MIVEDIDMRTPRNRRPVGKLQRDSLVVIQNGDADLFGRIDGGLPGD